MKKTDYKQAFSKSQSGARRFLCLASLSVWFVSAGCMLPDSAFNNLPEGSGHDGNQPASNSSNSANDLFVGPQTVSSYMGINISGDMPFNDITYVLAPFDTASANQDANGFPLPGFNGTSTGDFGFALTTGDYNISYVGDGTLQISGVGVLTQPWQTVNGEHRSVVHITNTPGSFGNSFTMAITNAPGQSVTALHIFLPGVAYDTLEVFNANLLKALTPFRQMRFMGVLGTNGSTVLNWEDQSVSNQIFASGWSYDMIVALINETGKDAWINIPHLASDEYVTKLDSYLLNHLNMTQINILRAAQGYSNPFRIYVEYSNEAWAPGSAVFNYEQTIANNNPARYDGVYTDNYGPSFIAQSPTISRAGQVEADRLVHITQMMKTTFTAAGQPDCITPVLGGWAIGAGYSDDGLQFIQRNYPGPVSNYVSYIALAPYFGVTDDNATNTLSNLFSNIGDGTNAGDGLSSAAGSYSGFASLASAYGVKIAAYEGGQGLGGTTNLHVKRLAGVDRRMYTAYKNYYAMWKNAFGPSALFNHFELGGTVGTPEFIGQYGFWDSVGSLLFDLSACTQNIPELLGNEDWADVQGSCPKYKAIIEE